MDSEIARSVLAGVPMPLVLITDDRRIREMNPPARDLFGPGLEGRHVLALVRQPNVLDSLERALADGIPQETRLTEADHAQDTIYRVVCAPVRLGARNGVLVSFADVTPLETAGQMRRDFVANVSHELRTPLTAILGFIETLRGPARHDAAARDRFLATMEQEAERMNRLVRDLLSLSRVESEERVRPTELVDIGALVMSARHSLLPLAGGLAIEVTGTEQTHEVPGDADQILQVMTNLIENAIKYGGEGGRIEIRIGEIERDPVLRGPGIEVDVHDFGAGIDPIHIHRLTERFYRADSHRSRELGGTGLGLAIVKHIMNRHRGHLRIRSEPGQGSSFSVVFPRARR